MLILLDAFAFTISLIVTIFLSLLAIWESSYCLGADAEEILYYSELTTLLVYLCSILKKRIIY